MISKKKIQALDIDPENYDLMYYFLKFIIKIILHLKGIKLKIANT
jgi:hypothetical protein